MFLCLAYDSVFLSFLALPPVNKIKHLSDLATAVENGEYHCMTYNLAGFENVLFDLNQKHFKVIGTHIKKNNGTIEVFENFIRKSKKTKLAFFTHTTLLDRFGGQYVISEDRFCEIMAGMAIRKDFVAKSY